MTILSTVRFEKFSYRKNCFTTDYFKGCLETLQLSDEEAQIQLWIKQIRGAELGGLGTLAPHFKFLTF
jgi:hypothetical protein